MENKEKYGWKNYKRIDAVNKKEVTVVKLLIGEGTDTDPFRHTHQFWDENGNFLFEIDPYTKN